jgi:ABC-type branched-subunit amino acid transport system substrate-binding protein
MTDFPNPDFSPLSRRRILSLTGTAGLSLMAAACGGGGGLDPLPSQGQQPAPQAGGSAAPGGPNIGTGSVRVGLILPLSAQGPLGQAANAIRNAADLAISELQNQDIMLLVKDDRGDAGAARDAVQQALGEGAEMILGPFAATSVQAASQVSKSAGRPMIAFSSDTSVAQPGVYLLSFTPQSDVARIMGYAQSRGKANIGAFLPEGAFGNVIAAEYQQQIARLGLSQGPTVRYQPGRAADAARQLAGQMSGVDALLTTDLTADMVRTADALNTAGIKNVQMLGTGTWNDNSVLSKPALAGGWFAAPDASGFNSFAQRYNARFKANPTRMATIGYDAVALTVALVRSYGSSRFSAQNLTNPSGFAGQDGVFRFRADGTNERALAVLQAGGRGATVVSAAPRGFGGQS